MNVNRMKLNNGLEIPKLGFGTIGADGGLAD